MKDLSFSEFARQIEVPRTSVYTRMNQIKKQDPEKYDRYINANGDSLKIRAEYVEALTDLFKNPAPKPLHKKQDRNEDVQYLEQALEESEERYQHLFQEYTQLVRHMQEVNQQLMALMMDQMQQNHKKTNNRKKNEDLGQMHLHL